MGFRNARRIRSSLERVKVRRVRLGCFLLSIGGSIMRILVLTVFCAMALTAFSMQQAEAALLGTSCSNEVVGKTRMDTDNKNIIACVCATTANCATLDLKWKAMSNSSIIACETGKVMTGIDKGVAVCTTPTPVGTTTPTGPADCNWAKVAYTDTTACTLNGARGPREVLAGNGQSQPSVPSGTSVGYNFSCTITDNASGNYHYENYTGAATCVNGTWQCTQNGSVVSCPVYHNAGNPYYH